MIFRRESSHFYPCLLDLNLLKSLLIGQHEVPGGVVDRHRTQLHPVLLQLVDVGHVRRAEVDQVLFVVQQNELALQLQVLSLLAVVDEVATVVAKICLTI